MGVTTERASLTDWTEQLADTLSQRLASGLEFEARGRRYHFAGYLAPFQLQEAVACVLERVRTQHGNNDGPPAVELIDLELSRFLAEECRAAQQALRPFSRPVRRRA